MEQPTVLFEDNHVIVAVKKPNQLVQGDGTGDSDLLSEVKEYIRVKYQKPGEAFVGLVHRMDRPVGGLLCFARTSKAASRLSEQVRTHAMRREYVCVVRGETPEDFTLRDWLVKDEKNNRVSVLPPYLKAQGKEAVLHGHTVESKNGLSLCVIRLETGRAHQIRVQMSHAGHPLWGDARYGDGKPGEQIALWGMRLCFTQPTSGANMVFIAPAPRYGAFAAFSTQLDTLENLWPAIREVQNP